MLLRGGNQISLDITGWHQMDDEQENSKSLVLITRVGSTPTTGIKKKTLQLVWRVFFFICGV